jgi:hypothetical protein
MALQRFLLCRRCRTLHPLQLDGFHLSAEEEETFALDLQLFRSQHVRHGLEEATRTASAALHDRPVWDPMVNTWFEIDAGGDVLVVRSRRSSIEEPRCYSLESTSPEREDGGVEIDSALVRRALDRHFFPHAIAPAKLDRFVAALGDLATRLDPAAIETSFDDADYADAGIAPLPEDVCRALLARSADIFDAWELERVRSFVAENSDEVGVLAIRVHRPIARLSA